MNICSAVINSIEGDPSIRADMPVPTGPIAGMIAQALPVIGPNTKYDVKDMAKQMFAKLKAIAMKMANTNNLYSWMSVYIHRKTAQTVRVDVIFAGMTFTVGKQQMTIGPNMMHSKLWPGTWQ